MFREQLFAEFKKAVSEGRLAPHSTVAFQLDDCMQGLSQQFVTGMAFEMAFSGNLDEMGVWIQSFTGE